LDWIELDIQVGETGLDFDGNVVGSQDTLERGSSLIISFEEFVVHVLLGDQFQNWLEAVGVQAQVRIDTL
jgi:hypothetical protein